MLRSTELALQEQQNIWHTITQAHGNTKILRVGGEQNCKITTSHWPVVHLYIKQLIMDVNHPKHEVQTLTYAECCFFSPWAGSPSSHACKWQRAKRCSWKESGEEVPRKWACLGLCIFFHFCLAWAKWHNWLMSRKGVKTATILCLMRSD